MEENIYGSVLPEAFNIFTKRQKKDSKAAAKPVSKLVQKATRISAPPVTCMVGIQTLN